MDVEVQRAYRVLQRAGITTVPMSPAMSLEELTKNYGRLIWEWLRQQGVEIQLIRTNVSRYQTDIQTHFQGLKTTQRGVVPGLNHHSQVAINLPADAPEEDIQAAFWSHITPLGVQNLMQTLNTMGPDPSWNWKAVIVVVLFVGGIGGGPTSGLTRMPAAAPTSSSAAGYIYGCRPPSEAEKTAEEARRAKAAAKAARDAENRRKRQETKEKEQLKKLVAKYGKDVV